MSAAVSVGVRSPNGDGSGDRAELVVVVLEKWELAEDIMAAAAADAVEEKESLLEVAVLSTPSSKSSTSSRRNPGALVEILVLSPKILVLVEQDFGHNGPFFPSRFMEALQYYSSIFDSLDAMLPKYDTRRAKIEQFYFMEEIKNIGDSWVCGRSVKTQLGSLKSAAKSMAWSTATRIYTSVSYNHAAIWPGPANFSLKDRKHGADGQEGVTMPSCRSQETLRFKYIDIDKIVVICEAEEHTCTNAQLWNAKKAGLTGDESTVLPPIPNHLR
nr:DELLA protein RGL1-like [Ipomoea batatas]